MAEKTPPERTFRVKARLVLTRSDLISQYLGPSISQLIHLFILVAANSLVLFALTLLLARTLWSMSLNMTTIESWEIERHETLLRRARTLGGYLHAPDGSKFRIEHQEFPWDIGIWTNLCQMMGTRNPIAWFWPLAKSLNVERGLQFEHNGIDGMCTSQPVSAISNNALQIQASRGHHRIQIGCFEHHGSRFREIPSPNHLM